MVTAVLLKDQLKDQLETLSSRCMSSRTTLAIYGRRGSLRRPTSDDEARGSVGTCWTITADEKGLPREALDTVLREETAHAPTLLQIMPAALTCGHAFFAGGRQQDGDWGRLPAKASFSLFLKCQSMAWQGV
ncbi:hypothetical protein Pcinc_001264 [Petrolisthes cinctipes]|uniref:Uncharacterized protein n=1 Tax=Petrolisthes cinctipes TaxID=88211 RepID=A0AAE1GN91_PETCI|nr:hypothetical protein Pcinc_001264 [Petrolisthes cinctipes]